MENLERCRFSFWSRRVKYCHTQRMEGYDWEAYRKHVNLSIDNGLEFYFD